MFETGSPMPNDFEFVGTKQRHQLAIPKIINIVNSKVIRDSGLLGINWVGIASFNNLQVSNFMQKAGMAV